jgi:transposase-like protein
MATRKQPTPIKPGEREQFWRRHLLAADAKGGTLTEYAAAHRLKVGSLYEWRRILRRRGLLGQSAAKSSPAAFVPVVTATARTIRRQRPSGRLRAPSRCATAYSYSSPARSSQRC